MGNLSPHFTLKEMTVTQSGLTNIPNTQQVIALTKLCERVLEPIRAHFNKPVTVSSGFRCPAVNLAAGSTSTSSQHLFGEAADIEIEGVHNVMIYEFIRDHLQFDQLIAEKLKKSDPRAGWIHVSYREGRLRKECKSWLGGKNYPLGLHFMDA